MITPLIEEARTNLLASEEFDQWTAGINSTVIPNAVTAPDGTSTAAIDGHHVNICLRADASLPEQFGSYVLNPAPATPARTFG